MRAESVSSCVGSGVPGLQATTGVNGKLKLDYRPTCIDPAQLIVTLTDKRLTPRGYLSAINVVNLGYRRALQTAVTAMITVSDVSNGTRHTRIKTTTAFRSDHPRIVQSRGFYVSVVYSFGSTTKDKQADFEYDRSTSAW